MGDKYFLESTKGDAHALVSRLQAAGHEAGAVDDSDAVWFVPFGRHGHLPDWEAIIERHFLCNFLPSAPSVGQG